MRSFHSRDGHQGLVTTLLSTTTLMSVIKLQLYTRYVASIDACFPLWRTPLLPMPSDRLAFASFAVETFLYGLYLAVALLSLFLLYQRSRETKPFAGASATSIPLLVGPWALIVCITTVSAIRSMLECGLTAPRSIGHAVSCASSPRSSFRTKAKLRETIWQANCLCMRRRRCSCWRP